MLKKVTLCLMAVLSSAAALAGGPDNVPLPIASGVNLMAPHQEGSWSFGLQANYFEPNNDFNYALASQQTTATNSIVTDNQSRLYAVDSNYHWGWGADVTYHFPGEGRDVTLAFTQLNSSDSNSLDNDDGAWNSIGATGLSVGKGQGNIITGFDSASGKAKTNYDAVDLTFGQVITAGSRITLHPFAGLRYGYIDYEATGAYATNEDRTTGIQARNYQTELDSTFSGVGPRLGSDASVNLGSGFSLRGTLGVSLLVGNMDVDTKSTLLTYTDTSSTVLSSQVNGVHDVDTNTRVVPEADAKLSAMYHTDFNNGYGLGFEAGWQVTNYFDAIQNNTVSSTLDTSTTYTDFFMQGPFARVQLDAA